MFDMIGPPCRLRPGHATSGNCPRYVRQARAADLVHLHSEEMFEGAEAHGVQSSLKRIRLTLERVPTIRLIP